MKSKKRCSRCGSCCTDILPLSAEEKEQLREYAGKHPRILRHRHTDARKCIFLRRLIWRTRCAVYPVRPAICRVYDCGKPDDMLLSEWQEYLNGRSPESMYAVIHSTRS